MQKLLRDMKGLTLVEVIIASAIILVAVVALLGVHSLYIRTALTNSKTVKAAYLAEEGIEAVRFMRDSSWNNISGLTPGTQYGVVLSVSGWQASTTARLVDEFERYITVETVNRDANGDIASSGGTLDADTVLVTSTVSWPSAGATTTRSISTYLTNLWQ